MAGNHASAGEPLWRVAERVDIETVPSWFPVGFSLLTHGQRQYVAYYDAKHQMTVGVRTLGQRQWHSVKLDSKVGWDSHNSITMAVDGNGELHVSGNMHCVPLVYFRTDSPGDIATLKRLPMIGEDEKRCTYPHFLFDAAGRLVFDYRDAPAAGIPAAGLPGSATRHPHVAFATGDSWRAVAVAYARRSASRIAASDAAGLLGELSPSARSAERADTQTERIAQLLAVLRARLAARSLELGAEDVLPAEPRAVVEWERIARRCGMTRRPGETPRELLARARADRGDTNNLEALATAANDLKKNVRRGTHAE